MINSKKYKFFVFSMAFFIFLIMLISIPATDESNKFLSGLCLGFLLSQAVYLLWIQYDHIEEKDNINDMFGNDKKKDYKSEYWWNDGKRPFIDDKDDF